jgi:uncharacterized membrane protein
MKIWVIAYLAAALVMAALDALWLTFASGALYRPILGDILLDGFRPAPAIVFYLLYVFGMVVFAIAPALADGRWTTALALGALFGLVAYATYDLSNQATMKAWSLRITLADMAWGTFLTAVSASAGFLAASRFQ